MKGGVNALEIVRVGTCIVLITALVIIGINAEGTLSGTNQAGGEPSAIQAAQVYVQNAFYAILAIGAAIGVYVATRAFD